jgi:hypothetical protein
MLPVPNDVLQRYEVVLKNRDISGNLFAEYKKWLRYFFDFRTKYAPPDSKSEQICQFSEKLREKKQTNQ